MAKPGPLRTHIRAALDSMPTVASTEVLAKAAVDRMSDEERYTALLALLPRLIRDEDRRRSTAASDHDDEQTAWVQATERRVRVAGEDIFLSDANSDQVESLASIRDRAASNIASSAERFRSLADAMARSAAETVAAVPAALGLQALRLRLRAARRRVANRDALVRLQSTVQDLSESPDLTAARTALETARERLDAAAETARVQERQLQTLREGLPPSLHPLVDRADRAISRIAS